MTVAINTERAGVEISWDPTGAPEEPPAEEKPPGFPAHPIFIPGTPAHPIYLPPYVDNSLPGEGLGIWGPTDPRPSNPIELPPDIADGIDDEELKQKILDFALGNLPPYEGGPEYPAPVHSEAIGVQVFAQGQDGDWSNTGIQPNDGLALLSYPKGFSGSSYVEVRALDGSLVDSGTIEVST